jgi:hypothetical protein
VPKVASREYKVMLRSELFGDCKPALQELRNDLAVATASLDVRQSGNWKLKEKQIICFIDTPEHTFLSNGLVFRRREKVNAKKIEYTLKCRSADRYIASGIDLNCGDDFKADPKLEEDISPPFLCRTSRSSTILLKTDRYEEIGTIDAAARLFPILGTLRRDGIKCVPETLLSTVNNVIAHEQVYGGINVHIGDSVATIAAILWSKGSKGGIFAAELSFRIESKKEVAFERVAVSAQRYFLTIQQLECCAPNLPTKTQIVYKNRISIR